MSGRHRVVRPRRRFGLVVVMVPARVVWRGMRACWPAVAGPWRRLVERMAARFEDRDPFADITLATSTTTLDLVPALPAAWPEPAPEREAGPLALAPEQVLPVLHTQHPHLPVAHVLWQVNHTGVSGEVNALDADASARRRIVDLFATALAVSVEEARDGDHVTVYATAEVGTVPVTVAAVLLAEEAVPLGVFEETTQDPTLQDDTQATQQIPDALIREVVSA